MQNNDICIIGDVHAGVRNDSRLFTDNMISYFSKVFQYIKENEIKYVIMLGDVFERRKFVNFETLYRFKREVIDVFKEMDCLLYIIAGNHDVYYKNTNRINSLELVLPKEEYPNIRHITQTAEELVVGDKKFIFVPWINQENYGDIKQKIESTDATYMVAHLELAGFEMHRGAVSEHGHFETDFLDKFSYVLTGHYHRKSSRGNIHYLGTPYETSWNDYNEEKGFHILSNDGLEFIKNDFQIFYRFIYDEKSGTVIELTRSIKDMDLRNKYVKLIVKSKKNIKIFERFVEILESKGIADLNIIDETNFISSTDEEGEEFGDTLDAINVYINRDLETDLDKQKLFNNMAKLYQCALEITDGD